MDWCDGLNVQVGSNVTTAVSRGWKYECKADKKFDENKNHRKGRPKLALNTMNQLPQFGLDKIGSGVNCHIMGWPEFKTDGSRFVGQNVHI